MYILIENNRDKNKHTIKAGFFTRRGADKVLKRYQENRKYSEHYFSNSYTIVKVRHWRVRETLRGIHAIVMRYRQKKIDRLMKQREAIDRKLDSQSIPKVTE